MDIFERDKYLFAGKFRLYKAEDRISYAKEISFLSKEMRLYSVDFEKLINSKLDINVKNLCLNLAFFILGNSEYISEFNVKRDLPIKKLNKFTGVTKGFLEKWRNYIVTYTLIMSNPTYANIQRYLNVTEKDTESKSLVLVDASSKDNREHTGLVLKARKKKSIILTCDGNFIVIKTAGAVERLGSIVSGKEKRGIGHYKKIIVAAIFIFAIALSAYYYIINRSLLTVVINSTSPITIEVNSLDKIKDINSPTNKGTKLVNSLKVKNRNVDDGVLDILSYIKENNMIPKDKAILIVITGSGLSEDKLEKSEEFLKDNSIKVIINNGGQEKRIN